MIGTGRGFSWLLFGLLALVLCLKTGSCQERMGFALPAFDVVSVRKVEPQDFSSGGSSMTYRPSKPCVYASESVRCQLDLWSLIEQAYEVKPYGLTGPDWLSVDVFAIQATMPAGTTKETARLMLRRALMDRFGLKVHSEEQEHSCYFLVAAKKGIKLEAAASDPKLQERRKVDTPMGSIQASMSTGRGFLFAYGFTLDLFAQNIANYVDPGVPILNKTGLTGQYKFDLHWIPADDAGVHGTMQDPMFAVAMERQFGLRLEKGKAIFQTLVVDHAERIPTEN